MATVTAEAAPKAEVIIPAADLLRAEAESSIKRNMAWSAGAGILPLPLFDMVAITGVQLKTVKDLCDIYHIPFSNSLVRPIVVSLLGSLGAGMLAPALAITTFKLVPGISTLLSGTALSMTSAGITYAVGHLFLDHFQAGGTLENFNLIAGRSVFKSKVQQAVAEQKTAEPGPNA